MREWWSKLARALHLRRGLDDDLSDEMRAHLELMTDDNLERGMPPGEACAAARRHFGNLTRTQERAREAWQFPRLETFLQDIRYVCVAFAKPQVFPWLSFSRSRSALAPTPQFSASFIPCCCD